MEAKGEFTMRASLLRGSSLIALLAIEGVAFAQRTASQPPAKAPNHTLTDLFVYPPALAWLLIVTIASWLVSVVIVGMLNRSSYPPLLARIACWIGATGWLIAVTFFVVGYILHIGVPIYTTIIIICLLLVLGVLLFATRPQQNAQ
jgi:hypothetical protein